jgi:hypothetical protein
MITCFDVDVRRKEKMKMEVMAIVMVWYCLRKMLRR